MQHAAHCTPCVLPDPHPTFRQPLRWGNAPPALADARLPSAACACLPPCRATRCLLRELPACNAHDLTLAALGCAVLGPPLGPRQLAAFGAAVERQRTRKMAVQYERDKVGREGGEATSLTAFWIILAPLVIVTGSAQACVHVLARSWRWMAMQHK